MVAYIFGATLYVLRAHTCIHSADYSAAKHYAHLYTHTGRSSIPDEPKIPLPEFVTLRGGLKTGT